VPIISLIRVQQRAVTHMVFSSILPSSPAGTAQAGTEYGLALSVCVGYDDHGTYPQCTKMPSFASLNQEGVGLFAHFA
jgi:hypothetical protein